MPSPSSLITPLLITLLLAVAPPTQTAAENGLAYHPCRSYTDCRYLSPFKYFCYATDPATNQPTRRECGSEVAHCACFPLFAIVRACPSDDDVCRDGERCASHVADGGKRYCTDCAVVAERPAEFQAVDGGEATCGEANLTPTPTPPPTRTFTPEPKPTAVKTPTATPPQSPTQTPTTTPSPSPSPPTAPKGLLQHCSPSRRCDEEANITCLAPPTNVIGYNFCSATDVACRCFRFPTADVTPRATCATHADCAFANRSVCARDVRRANFSECVACSFARRNIFYKAVDGVWDACEGRDDDDEGEEVSYATTGNGLKFDPCKEEVRDDGLLKSVRNSVCREGLSCRQDPTACHPFSSCCQPPKSKPDPQTCAQHADCHPGEACVTDHRINPQHKTCASRDYLTELAKFYSAAFTFVGGSPPPLPAVPAGGGWTGDACRFDWGCVGARRCTHYDGVFGGCANRSACICKRLRDVGCGAGLSSCGAGEQCVNYPDGHNDAFCISAAVAREDGLLRRVTGTPLPMGRANASAPLRGRGLNGDECRGDGDCVDGGGSRVCRHLLEGAGGCDGRRACVCRWADAGNEGCDSRVVGSRCGDRERCLRFRDSVRDGGVGKCFSEAAVNWPDIPDYYEEVPFPTPTATPAGNRNATTATKGGSGDGEEAGVCIAAKAMRHVKAGDLVFRRRRRAAVLCDGGGACATEGHMVAFEGRFMTMRSYCERGGGGCVRRVMEVNSPRMRRGWRLQTGTEGLWFTALAARSATRVEEVLLRAVLTLLA